MTAKHLYDILSRDYSDSVWINRYKFVIEYKDRSDTINEEHHILPRSLYPDFATDHVNIRSISVRQHYLAHYILMKMTNTFEMSNAFKLMCTTRSKNSRLFEQSKTEIRKHRLGKCSLKNKYTGLNELVDYKEAISSGRYINDKVGRTRYKDMRTGKFIYSFQKPNNNCEVGHHHDNVCHGTVYWNGSKRVSDISQRTGRTTGYEAGNAILNDDSKSCVIDLIEKTYKRIDNTDVCSRYYKFEGQSLDNIFILQYKSFVFIGRLNLPVFAKETYSKIKRDITYFDNKKLGYVRDHYDETIRCFILRHKGKTMKSVGFSTHKLLDFEFDLDKHTIATTEQCFVEFLKRECGY